MSKQRPSYVLRDMPDREIPVGRTRNLGMVLRDNLKAKAVGLEFAPDGKEADIIIDLGSTKD
ncbi:MAG: hypothetical protein AAF213_13525, partial [Pseudomonadota bacterium]